MLVIKSIELERYLTSLFDKVKEAPDFGDKKFDDWAQEYLKTNAETDEILKTYLKEDVLSNIEKHMDSHQLDAAVQKKYQEAKEKAQREGVEFTQSFDDFKSEYVKDIVKNDANVLSEVAASTVQAPQSSMQAAEPISETIGHKSIQQNKIDNIDLEPVEQDFSNSKAYVIITNKAKENNADDPINLLKELPKPPQEATNLIKKKFEYDRKEIFSMIDKKMEKSGNDDEYAPKKVAKRLSDFQTKHKEKAVFEYVSNHSNQELKTAFTTEQNKTKQAPVVIKQQALADNTKTL